MNKDLTNVETNDELKSDGVVRKTRIEYGVRILLAMKSDGVFPFKNKNRLCTVMQRYYNEVFAEKEKKLKHKWQPTIAYWCRLLAAVRSRLRKKKRFLEFVRNTGGFEGLWMFVNKKEYIKVARRNIVEINTRAENSNESIEDAGNTWKGINLPPYVNLPLLPLYVEI